MKFPDIGGGGSGGGANYLRLKDKESIQGVFRGDPLIFRRHWIQGQGGVVCPGKAECELCKKGERPNFRFKINFVIKENDAYVAKVWDQSWTVFEMLKALHEGDYNLEKHIMKITRHGEGTDTTYSIIPKPNGALTEAQEKAISAVPLVDFGAQESEEDDQDANEEAPF